jgi:hypothetical protein
MRPAFHQAFLKSSIIGGLRANDEVGSAAWERPQMKSVNGMCIITSNTNHQRSSAVYRRLYHRQPSSFIHLRTKLWQRKPLYPPPHHHRSTFNVVQLV